MYAWYDNVLILLFSIWIKCCIRLRNRKQIIPSFVGTKKEGFGNPVIEKYRDGQLIKPLPCVPVSEHTETQQLQNEATYCFNTGADHDLGHSLLKQVNIDIAS